MKRLLVCIALILLAVPGQAPAADTLTLAAGAGYKQFVEELARAFETETGIVTERVYGNMGQITSMARESGKVDVVAGDKRFLDGSGLPFADERVLGKGRLVLALARGVAADSVADLAKPAIRRVAMPDPEKAIYGRAADECLTSEGLKATLQDKLLVVATVPQVTAYLVSGEVDAGFINLTDALPLKDKIGGVVAVREDAYRPILIVAKTMAGAPHPAAIERFAKFLEGGSAKAVAARHGL